MTVNEIIINALKRFKHPCKPDLYTGKENHYFTFNYADERGADYGDNTPSCDIAYMQIHYFLPLNEDYLKEKDHIKNTLFAAGFTYPAVTILTIPEKNIRHIVFECEIATQNMEG